VLLIDCPDRKRLASGGGLGATLSVWASITHTDKHPEGEDKVCGPKQDAMFEPAEINQCPAPLRTSQRTMGHG